MKLPLLSCDAKYVTQLLLQGCRAVYQDDAWQSCRLTATLDSEGSRQYLSGAHQAAGEQVPGSETKP